MTGLVTIFEVISGELLLILLAILWPKAMRVLVSILIFLTIIGLGILYSDSIK